MFDFRVYRAAFLPFVFVAALALFSFKEPVQPLKPRLAPDAFVAARAYQNVVHTVKTYPDRRPGSGGNSAAAAYISNRMATLGYEVRSEKFRAEAGGRDVSMQNVVGTLRGKSDRRLVVIAHRDSNSVPGASSSASGTGVLLELAQDFSDLVQHKTVVFVSSDGATAGAAGARYFRNHLTDKDNVDAVLVLDDLGQKTPKQPVVDTWSTGYSGSSPELAATATRELKLEAGTPTLQSGLFSQFARKALPIALREQGPLLAGNLPAITISSHGDLPAAGPDTLSALSAGTLGGMGRATLGTLLALDRPIPIAAGPTDDFTLLGKSLPGWVVKVLSLALLLPLLLAAVDGFARSRRWRVPTLKWLAWVLYWFLPLFAALVISYLFSWFGWLTDVPPSDFYPQLAHLSAGAIVGWVAFIAVAVGLLILGRKWLAWLPEPKDEDELGSASVALCICMATSLFIAWLVNPFAVLLLLPAAHVVAVATRPDERLKLAGIVAGTIFGLVLPATVFIYYALALNLGPLNLLYYLTLLVSGRAVAFPEALLLCLLGSVTLAAGALLLAKLRTSRETSDISVRGPDTYAGPGSLGGTESAIGKK